MSPATGVALPQHYENPDFLGIEHLKIASSLPHDRARAILLDIKDIYGHVFVETEIEEYRRRIRKEYLSYLREIIALRQELGYELYVGVPALYDLKIGERDWLMENDRGERIQGWICPNQQAYVDLLGRFIAELAENVPVTTVFLPFCRYRRIERRGLTCCCPTCMQKFSASLSGTRTIEPGLLRRRPSLYSRWIDWRTREIRDFLAELRDHMPTEEVGLGIEVDLDPERYVDEGIRVNDGHDFGHLAEAVDELIVHLYDRTEPPEEVEVGEPPHWNSVLYQLGRLKRLDASLTLLFWGIREREDLVARQRLSDAIAPHRSFYLLFSHQTGWLRSADHGG